MEEQEYIFSELDIWGEYSITIEGQWSIMYYYYEYQKYE